MVLLFCLFKCYVCTTKAKISSGCKGNRCMKPENTELQIEPETSITSDNGDVILTMRKTGRLRLTCKETSRILWNTWTMIKENNVQHLLMMVSKIWWSRSETFHEGSCLSRIIHLCMFMVQHLHVYVVGCLGGGGGGGGGGLGSNPSFPHPRVANSIIPLGNLQNFF